MCTSGSAPRLASAPPNVHEHHAERCQPHEREGRHRDADRRTGDDIGEAREEFSHVVLGVCCQTLGLQIELKVGGIHTPKAPK